MIDNKPGTYVLLIELTQPQTVTVGRRGPVSLPAGLLGYVGSAHGPGGLAARLRRHARPDKRLHWHVDFLLTVATLNGALYRTDPVRLECRWATAIQPQALAPIPNFGASDCHCDTHLFHLGVTALQVEFVAWAAKSLGTSYTTEF